MSVMESSESSAARSLAPKLMMLTPLVSWNALFGSEGPDGMRSTIKMAAEMMKRGQWQLEVWISGAPEMRPVRFRNT